jgi:hypothetical protein
VTWRFRQRRPLPRLAGCRTYASLASALAHVVIVIVVSSLVIASRAVEPVVLPVQYSPEEDLQQLITEEKETPG